MTIIPHFRGLGTTPLVATAALPASTMRIFYGEPFDATVAENVKIGDPLTMLVGIDDQVTLIHYEREQHFLFISSRLVVLILKVNFYLY